MGEKANIQQYWLLEGKSYLGPIEGGRRLVGSCTAHSELLQGRTLVTIGVELRCFRYIGSMQHPHCFVGVKQDEETERVTRVGVASPADYLGDSPLAIVLSGEVYGVFTGACEQDAFRNMESSRRIVDEVGNRYLVALLLDDQVGSEATRGERVLLAELRQGLEHEVAWLIHVLRR